MSMTLYEPTRSKISTRLQNRDARRSETARASGLPRAHLVAAVSCATRAVAGVLNRERPPGLWKIRKYDISPTAHRSCPERTKVCSKRSQCVTEYRIHSSKRPNMSYSLLKEEITYAEMATFYNPNVVPECARVESRWVAFNDFHDN